MRILLKAAKLAFLRKHQILAWISQLLEIFQL